MILSWSDRALSNLFDHLYYIREANPSAAQRVAFEIERQTLLLTRFPELGRSGRLSGTRELVIDRTPFIAVYSVGTDSIRILRLLHGAQKFY
ncbi:MAG TPA: type II toxin-antitoxin system RelE/ParE family toxin [Acidobacteriaceae bacterium]|nr:type II toxin-antitoxin system RelE/ParE family toxin [Acidobacteriaceae bacterium]